MDRRGPGRPPFPTGKAKVGVFAIRLSAEERAAIRLAAERAGLSVSEWARNELLEAANRPIPKS
jgi:predicted HicB family RNase H-like nuclease